MNRLARLKTLMDTAQGSLEHVARITILLLSGAIGLSNRLNSLRRAPRSVKHALCFLVLVSVLIAGCNGNDEQNCESGGCQTVRVFDIEQLVITAEGPVDMAVTDARGETISKSDKMIEEATYIEADLNGDGCPEDKVTILHVKEGSYKVWVQPQDDREPQATFSLYSTLGGTTTILAEDIPVDPKPEQPYAIDTSALSSVAFSIYLKDSSVPDSEVCEVPVDLCFYDSVTGNLKHAFSGIAASSEGQEYVTVDVHSILPGSYDITVGEHPFIDWETDTKEDVVISEGRNSVDMGKQDSTKLWEWVVAGIGTFIVVLFGMLLIHHPECPYDFFRWLVTYEVSLSWYKIRDRRHPRDLRWLLGYNVSVERSKISALRLYLCVERWLYRILKLILIIMTICVFLPCLVLRKPFWWVVRRNRTP